MANKKIFNIGKCDFTLSYEKGTKIVKILILAGKSLDLPQDVVEKYTKIYPRHLVSQEHFETKIQKTDNANYSKRKKDLAERESKLVAREKAVAENEKILADLEEDLNKTKAGVRRPKDAVKDPAGNLL